MERKFTGTRSIANLRKAFLDYQKDETSVDIYQVWIQAKAEHPNNELTKELDKLFERVPPAVRAGKPSRYRRDIYCETCSVLLTRSAYGGRCTPCQIEKDIAQGYFPPCSPKYQKQFASLLVEAKHNAAKHPDWCPRFVGNIPLQWLAKYPEACNYREALNYDYSRRSEAQSGFIVGHALNLFGTEKICKVIPNTKIQGKFHNRKLVLSLVPGQYIPVWLRELAIAAGTCFPVADRPYLFGIVQNALDGDIDGVYNYIGGLQLQREYERQD